MHGSKYVTNQSMHEPKYVTNTPTSERCWLQISSIHPNDENQETPWLQNPWLKDVMASTKNMMNLGNCLQSQFACIMTLHQVA